MNPVKKILGRDIRSKNFTIFPNQNVQTRQAYWDTLKEMQRYEDREGKLPQSHKARIVKEHNIPGKNWNRWTPSGYGTYTTAPGTIQQPVQEYPLREGEMTPQSLTQARVGIRGRIGYPYADQIQEQKKFQMAKVDLTRGMR